MSHGTTCPPRSSFAVSSPISCRRNFGASAITASSSTASARRNSSPAAPCLDWSIGSVPTSPTWKHSWKGKASTTASVCVLRRREDALRLHRAVRSRSTPVLPRGGLRQKLCDPCPTPEEWPCPSSRKTLPPRRRRPAATQPRTTARSHSALQATPTGSSIANRLSLTAPADGAQISIGTIVKRARFDRHSVQQERSS
jgi:hypothetical protein